MNASQMIQGVSEPRSWRQVVAASGAAAALLAFVAGHVSASIVVDDFESYPTNAFPNANWTTPPGDIASLSDIPGQSVAVVNDGNNLSGNHVRFETTYQADSIVRSLDLTLDTDGQYVQVGVNILSGRTLASMFLSGSPYAGGPGAFASPPASVGVSSETGNVAFTTQANSVGDASKRVDSLVPTLGTWYYLRATMRDLGGVVGVIDSYDFDVYDSSMTLLGSKLGTAFIGGEGDIGSIALYNYEQTGTQNAVTLFDEVTTNVPEPTSLALLAAGAMCLAGRKRQAA